VNTLSDHARQKDEYTIHDPDGELVVLSKEGVHSAFTELCERHEYMIYRVLKRILANNEDTEDALQDCFLRAYSHIDRFDGRAKFSTWLTRIAINTALMVLRKRSRRPLQSIDEMEESELACVLYPLSTSLDPEAQFQRDEISKILRSAIHCLPPNLRDVTEIRLSADLSVRQIAQQIGISEAATKSRLLRARGELSARLQSRQRIRDKDIPK
jgi:RNA polymerase sigma-70 factor (ECF subfamily)